MTEREALKLALQLVSNLRTHSWTVADEQLVITAIKEALAQPEPVIDKSAAVRIATALGWEPKRTWHGLTDEELAEFSEAKLGAYDLCLEVEAKLKEKNT